MSPVVEFITYHKLTMVARTDAYINDRGRISRVGLWGAYYLSMATRSAQHGDSMA
jgi:hypothetical protein